MRRASPVLPGTRGEAGAGHAFAQAAFCQEILALTHGSGFSEGLTALPAPLKVLDIA
jgi:hypothetical protein